MTAVLDVEVIQAERIERSLNRRPNRTYPAGRVCGERRCDTVLSIYNGSDRCACHAGEGQHGRLSQRSGKVA